MIRSVGFFSRGNLYDWGYSQTVSFAAALEQLGIKDEITPYLSNFKIRNELFASGREKVMSARTWDHGAEVFIREISKKLEKVQC